MKKIILLLLLSILPLLTISLISADCNTVGQNGIDVYLINNSITVEGYTCVGIQNYNPTTGQYTITPQKFTSNTNPLFINRINKNVNSSVFCNTTVVENITYQANCTYSVNYHEDIPFLGVLSNGTNQSQPTVTDATTQQKYENCLTEKAQYVAGLNLCTESKKGMVDVSGNFTTCSTDLIQCRADKSIAENDRQRLTTDQENKKNQGYLWGIIGAILGILGTLWYDGKIGGNRARRPEERYNVQQAG